jgi:hypothetical protein
VRSPAGSCEQVRSGAESVEGLAGVTWQGPHPTLTRPPAVSHPHTPATRAPPTPAISLPRMGCAPPPPPRGPAICSPSCIMLAYCLLRIGRQVSPCVAVTLMPWQRNLNLCGSPRSSSESRRPLDVISVCTLPGQHVG